MNRMTRWDPVCHCYKAVREQEMGRSVIQELGVYESIHEKEIEKAVNIGDIRDLYFTKGAKLDPYWENFGKEKAAPDNWIPVTKQLPPMGETVLVTNDGDEYFRIHGEGFVGKNVTFAYMTEEGWSFSDINYDCQFMCITAWQPLPDAYEGE